MIYSGIYLLEVEAWTGESVETFYFSSDAFTTRWNDTPANTQYRPLIADLGAFERSISIDGSFGAPTENKGFIDIANANGELDGMMSHGFDGRDFVLKFIPDPRVRAVNAEVVLRGKIASLDTSSIRSVLRLRIADYLEPLRLPLLTERYAGTTNSTGATAEGDTDLKNQVKPLVIGSVFNIQPFLVNPYDLIYQVSISNVHSIAVYDGAAALTYGGNLDTIAQLQAETIAAGAYATARGLGLFRLGATPAFQITADVVEGEGDWLRSAARCAERVLALTDATIDSDGFNAADDFNTAEVGIFIDDESSALDAITQLLGSIGASAIATPEGEIGAVFLDVPSDDPEDTITETDIAAGESLSILAGPFPSGDGVPAWSFELTCKKIWHVMNEGEFAETVDIGRRNLLTQGFIKSLKQEATVKTAHLLALEIIADTLLTSTSACAAEAERRLALFGTFRLVAQITTTRERGDFLIGTTIRVDFPRFGFSGGRNMLIYGKSDDYNKRLVTYWLWG